MLRFAAEAASSILPSVASLRVTSDVPLARNFQSTFRFRGVLIACGTIGLANGARITGDSRAEGVAVSIIMVLARGNAAIVARITLARRSLTVRSGK